MRQEVLGTAMCNGKTIRLKINGDGMHLVNSSDLGKLINVPEGAFGDNFPTRDMVNYYVQKTVDKEGIYFNIMTSIDMKFGEMAEVIHKCFLNNGKFVNYVMLDGRDPYIAVNSIAKFLGVHVADFLEEVVAVVDVGRFRSGVLQFVYAYDIPYLLRRTGYQMPEELKSLITMGSSWYRKNLADVYQIKATPIVLDEANIRYIDRLGVVYWCVNDFYSSDEKCRFEPYNPTSIVPCIMNEKGEMFVRMKNLKYLLLPATFSEFIDSIVDVAEKTDDEEEAMFYTSITKAEGCWPTDEVAVQVESAQEPTTELMESPEMQYEVPDMVNNPPHYTSGGMEVIDILKAKLTPEEFKGFCKGNALKYLFRGELKGKELEDYEKAQWYLNRLIDVVKGE